jgi:hypothetical protein
LIEEVEEAQSDFGVTIDFAKGKSDPVKVFDALAQMLEGLRTFDDAIIGSIDPHLETTMVLQEVEANSITAWVRNRLRQVDDDALKEFDWKQQVGAYAVKAKYIALDYLDKKAAENENARLEQLRDDLMKIAQDASLRHPPLPATIDLKALATPLDQIQDAKKLLSKRDRVIVKSEGRHHELNLEVTKRPSDFIPTEKIESEASGTMPMTLLVRRPDYLGDTMWEFRHGRDAVNARIMDEEWLERFRSGAEVIVPGCALDCLVSYSYGYNASGELKTAKHDVVSVRKIINGSGSVQSNIFGEE